MEKEPETGTVINKNADKQAFFIHKMHFSDSTEHKMTIKDSLRSHPLVEAIVAVSETFFFITLCLKVKPAVLDCHLSIAQ